MINVLFVCHGNICRSTMAEYVFKDMINKKEMSYNFFVDSAGTSYEEIGNPVHYKTRKKLEENNIECGNHKARKMTKEDYDKFDYIIGMDEENIRNIIRIIGEDTENKVYKLLDFTKDARDIKDPWYTGDFETTYKDIVKGLEEFWKYLEYNKN